MPPDHQPEDMFLHLRREIEEAEREYFASKPGDHVDDRNNAQIFAFQGRYKNYPNDIGAITAYLKELQYRMTVMRTAQRYVDELKIGLPKNCRIFDVDFPRWEWKYGTDKLFEEGGAGTWWYDNLRNSGRLEKLFPGYERNAFFIPYDKGWTYLIVALAWAPFSRKDLNQRYVSFYPQPLSTAEFW